MNLNVFQRTIVDELGNTLPAAQIDVFIAGTATRPDLFSDLAGTTPITNPFNADSNGFAQFYTIDGYYDVQANLGGSSAAWDDVQIGTPFDDVIGAIGNITNPLLDMPLNNSLDLKQGVGSATFTRATTATCVDKYGIVQSAAIDVPRFEKKGFLIEGASTNLFKYSQEFDNALWSVTATGGATAPAVTANYATAPDGTLTADRIIFAAPGSTDRSIIRQSDTLSAGNNTESMWFKSTSGATQFISFHIEGGIMGDTLTVTDAWQRLDYSFTAGGGVSFNGLELIGTVAAAADILVWGAQMEFLPFASSYIPTTSADVTRASDLCLLAYSGNTVGLNEDDTVIVDCNPVGVFPALSGTNQHLLNFNQSNKYIRLMDNAGPPRFVNGVSSLLAPQVATAGVKERYAMVSDTEVKGYIDGVLVNSIPKDNTTGSMNQIGVGNSTTSQQAFAHITNLRIYDKALTDSEIILA